MSAAVEFDGDYGRTGRIEIKVAECCACKVNGPCLVADQSEGEYSPAVICLGCISKLFGATQPQAPQGAVTERAVRGFMCMTDFDHELGEASGGIKVYMDEEDLRESRTCLVQCGVVEVETRLVRVIQDSDFSSARAAPETPEVQG